MGVALCGPIQLESLQNPTGETAGEAWLFSDDERLYLTWIEKSKTASTVYFSSYDGTAWLPKKTIVSSDRLFVNWADFPKAAVNGRQLMAVWPEMIGEGHGYGLKYRLSENMGEQWGPIQWLHEDLSGVEYGFVSLVPRNQGFYAIWLDARAMGEDHSGDMQLRGRSIDAKKLGPEVQIDASTCDCCSTALMAMDDQLLAVYRDKTPAQIRDISLSRLKSDKWSAAGTLGKDNWTFHGCPVNGPAMDVRGKRAAIAWYTGAEPARTQVALYDGEKIGEPLVVSRDSKGRVDVVWLNDDHLLVTHMKLGQPIFSAALVSTKPKLSLITDQELDHLPAGRLAGFPQLARFKQRVFVVWLGGEPSGLRFAELKITP